LFPLDFSLSQSSEIAIFHCQREAHAEDAPSKDATVAPSVDVTSEPAKDYALRYGPPVAPAPAPVKATQQGVAWRCCVILCWQGFVWFALIRSYV